MAAHASSLQPANAVIGEHRNLQRWVLARHWAQQAAVAGNATAQVQLAMLYHFGFGCRKDAAAAYSWAQKAAAQGQQGRGPDRRIARMQGRGDVGACVWR